MEKFLFSFFFFLGATALFLLVGRYSPLIAAFQILSLKVS
jgi:hypothetical protein